VNVLKPHLRTTAWTLLEAGASQREIQRVTGIDRKTLRGYQKRFAAALPANFPGEVTDSPEVSAGSAQQTPPPRPPASAPVAATVTASACEPHRAFIEAQLRLRRNAMAIYQDLVDLHGFTGAYNSVKRFVGKLRHREPEQFDRLAFLPGEEMQVDYGNGAPTRVPGTDHWRKPRLFVATLRYSRRSYRCVVCRSSQEAWARLQEQAWSHFGGSCRYVVLDNLKEGVLKPDLYEPELNPVYAAALAHCGAVPDPARVLDPNRKGSVENAISPTQATALKGRRFEVHRRAERLPRTLGAQVGGLAHSRQRTPPGTSHVRGSEAPSAALAVAGGSILHQGPANGLRRQLREGGSQQLRGTTGGHRQPGIGAGLRAPHRDP
jgi:transposase